MMKTEETKEAPSRIVHCEDALKWLETSPVLVGASLVTSLPDRSEFPALTLAGWQDWFVDAAALVLSRLADDGVAIFYQTDIKTDGRWIDKGYLVQKAAERTGHALVWHKLVCRKPPGTVTYGRAAYSHLLAFSRGLRVDLAKATSDVLPEAGDSTWTRGMGLVVCETVCRFVLDNTSTRTIVAPFCGHGLVLASANALGMAGIGIELSPKRARRARAATATGRPAT